MLKSDNIEDITTILLENGVLLHPTDTIWGLAADCYSVIGIDKIYNLKQRDKSKPLILLVDSLKMLTHYVPHIHPRIETLLSLYKNPLTVVYPDVRTLPSNLIAKDKSIAIRIVQDDKCKAIIKALGRPICSSSANTTGAPFPTEYDKIQKHIINTVDIIDIQRNTTKHLSRPSVMIKYDSKGEIIFLRS